MSKSDPVIKELEKTYDTNLLDIKSQEDQTNYEYFSIMNRNNGKGNKVIKELTYNHYTKYKPITEFIGGPKTLSIHWHPQYKKLIYIFGESHADNMDCKKFKTTTGIQYPITVPIEDYLYDLMKSTDVFLDIYFEFPFYYPDRYSDFQVSPLERSSRLDKLFNKFKKCLMYDSRHEKSCRLARSHYFDIRHYSSNPLNLEKSKIDIVWVKSQFYQIFMYGRTNFAMFRLKKFLQNPIISDILRKLTDENNKNIYDFMINQLKENRYIKKELDQIVENSENLISAFNDFFYTQIIVNLMPNIDKIKRCANTLLNYVTKSDDELYDNINKLSFMTFSTIACFADAYLLARVFKDFNMDEIEKKAYKGATHQPKRAHNIIIYAGNAHSDNYRDFLSYIGFTEIDSTGIDLQNPYLYLPDKPKNCLDMRNIKQPFFSYKRYDESTFKVIKQSNRIRIPAIIKYMKKE
jgi:hypothetical protein